MSLLLYFYLFVYVAQACTPMCRYACDDPVCPAICSAKANAPNCTIQCNNAFIPNEGQCTFKCTNFFNTTSQCPSETCPAVEIKCSEVVCSNLPSLTVCNILCEAPTSGWVCTKPKFCKQPICQLQCEKPACEYNTAKKMDIKFTLFLLIILSFQIFTF